MPLIALETHAFPKTYKLNAFDQISTTWGDIIWAAVTVGRPNIHYVFQYGQPSLYEALFRISMVRMALEQARPYASHTIRRTEAFKALDPTEKGAINYFLGMVFCKVFAAGRLDIPWLLHIDAFRSQFSARFLAGRSRPDLVGKPTSGSAWAAFECKGRASSPNADDRTKAKDQAERIVSVNGLRCRLHVAAFTYFGGDTLKMICDDPDGGDEGEVLRAGDEQWRFYYAPAFALAERLEQADGAVVRELDELDLKLEIHPKIMALLRGNQWSAAHDACGELADLLKSEGFKPDGIKVTAGPSWSEKLSLR
ncbi:hypothetical protein ACU8M5_10690 [Rhizobium leguminosarum]